MLEQYNHLWFSYINAPAGLNGWKLDAAIASAEWLIWLIPLGLTCLWLAGFGDNRQAAVKALLAAIIALTINQGVSLLWFHARPFMDGVGHTYLSHVPDSSFPSDHMTLMLSVGLAMVTARPNAPRRIGSILIALSPVVAWARIYLGVHYPFDMLGAFAVAIGSTLIISTRMGQVLCERVVFALELLYRYVLSRPIARGWVRW